jgi:hypothetical protein
MVWLEDFQTMVCWPKGTAKRPQITPTKHLEVLREIGHVLPIYGLEASTKGNPTSRGEARLLQRLTYRNR